MQIVRLNIIGRKILILLIAIYFSCFVHAVCKVNEFTIISAKNPEECSTKLADLVEECGVFPVNDAVRATVQANCSKIIMNKEIDVMLKKLNKTDYAQQMKTQSFFNKAVKNYCNQYDKCGFDEMVYEKDKEYCLEIEYEFRYEQVKNINSGSLKIETLQPKNEFQKSLFPIEFEDYIDGVCQMGDEIWANKKTPSNCHEVIKNQLKNSGVGYNVCTLEDEEN